jgi:tetratricopeptide (TPR) repeat protein
LMLIGRALRYVRAYGLGAVLRRARASLAQRRNWRRNMAPADAFALPEVSLRAFSEVRLARGVKAIEDSLQYFAAQVLPPGMSLFPLDWARAQIAAGPLSDNAIERTLQELIANYPDWAECRLELGHLLFDQGRVDEALQSYVRAAAGTPMIRHRKPCPDPRADAHFALAQLFATRGQVDDAARAYASSLALEPNQPGLSVEYGNLLRRLNRMEEAAEQFLRGIGCGERRWCVPSVGRNALTLHFSIIPKHADESQQAPEEQASAIRLQTV